MDKATIVKYVAHRLGNVRGLDALIEAEVDASIRRLENKEFHPWFLLSENNFYQCKVGESRVPIPQGFLAEYEDTCLYIKTLDNRWLPMTKMTVEEARRHGTLETGIPRFYSLTNGYFRVFPVPDDTYELELIFYRRSENLVGFSNVWFDNAGDLVVYETAATIFNMRQDKRWLQMTQMADREYQELIRRHTMREEVNTDRYFGGDY